MSTVAKSSNLLPSPTNYPYAVMPLAATLASKGPLNPTNPSNPNYDPAYDIAERESYVEPGDAVGKEMPENLWYMDPEYIVDLEGKALDAKKKDQVERLLSVNTANAAELLAQRIQKALRKWGKHEGDTGSPAASIAAMSERIKHLHVHMRANHKDKHSMYGINALINKRRYMLKYLAKKDYKSFKGLVEEYEISTLEIMTDQMAGRRGEKYTRAERRARRGKRRFPPYYTAE